MGGKIPSSVESRHEKIAMGSKLVISDFLPKTSEAQKGTKFSRPTM